MSARDPSLGAEPGDPMSWERKVLDTFFAGGRLEQIPARRKKRLVVLR